MATNSGQPYRVPFSGVGYRYSDADKAIVCEVMGTTSTLTQGAHQIAFEKKFAQFVSVPFAFATSSAVAALELAAVLADLKPGDEVICPAHTYCASAYPFARHGARLKWADIDRETFVISPDSVRSLVTEKTRVIVAVHLYGLPADITELRAIADDCGALLVEDCAQSIGASLEGAPTGSVGDLAVFSFQSHKNISTLGEGGMLTVRDPEMARRVPGLRHNGHRPFERKDNRYWHPAMTNVGTDLPGVWPHNFCLGEAQAALGSFLLDRVMEINDVRRQRYFKARSVLQPFPELVFQDTPEERISAHHLLPFRYDGQPYRANSHDFMERLAVKHRIQAATQYYPLYRYELFAESGHGEASVPETDEFFDNMVSLPFHVWMPEEDFDYMLTSVLETADHLRRLGGHWYLKDDQQHA